MSGLNEMNKCATFYNQILNIYYFYYGYHYLKNPHCFYTATMKQVSGTPEVKQLHVHYAYNINTFKHQEYESILPSLLPLSPQYNNMQYVHDF